MSKVSILHWSNLPDFNIFLLYFKCIFDVKFARGFRKYQKENQIQFQFYFMWFT